MLEWLKKHIPVVIFNSILGERPEDISGGVNEKRYLYAELKESLEDYLKKPLDAFLELLELHLKTSQEKFLKELLRSFLWKVPIPNILEKKTP